MIRKGLCFCFGFGLCLRGSDSCNGIGGVRFLQLLPIFRNLCLGEMWKLAICLRGCAASESNAVSNIQVALSVSIGGARRCGHACHTRGIAVTSSSRRGHRLEDCETHDSVFERASVSELAGWSTAMVIAIVVPAWRLSTC